MELYPLLQLAQGYLSAHYAQALVDRSKGAELRAYIAKYLYDTGYTVAGYHEGAEKKTENRRD